MYIIDMTPRIVIFYTHFDNVYCINLFMQTSHEGNVTTSELHWSPIVADAGKVLQCRAESPSITRAPPLVDDCLPDIYYIPMTTLYPGRSLNLSNIEEGDDVYFECAIKANPWVYNIVWLHEE
ncbi:hypothetical protein SK128_012452 [Halocaridina rubra]|uniref:Ig-like domain-containing protein n=1 Tax=Halocaridina rubra TaxID=373956 RepID=A0AAN8XJQ1_HALRR